MPKYSDFHKSVNKFSFQFSSGGHQQEMRSVFTLDKEHVHKMSCLFFRVYVSNLMRPKWNFGGCCYMMKNACKYIHIWVHGAHTFMWTQWRMLARQKKDREDNEIR